LEHWEQAKQNASCERNEESERKNAPICVNRRPILTDVRNVAGADSEEGADADYANNEAECATYNRESYALSKQLPDYAAAAGANGCPDRNLALPAHGAHKQETGNVRASDEQYEADSTREDFLLPDNVTVQGVLHRKEAESAFGTNAEVARKSATKLFCSNSQLRFCFFERDSPLEPACHAEVRVIFPAIGINLEGKPNVCHLVLLPAVQE
jgi:hypothetical protein